MEMEDGPEEASAHQATLPVAEAVVSQVSSPAVEPRLSSLVQAVAEASEEEVPVVAPKVIQARLVELEAPKLPVAPGLKAQMENS